MNRDEYIHKKVKSLLSHEKRGKLLDIGPGRGILTRDLRKQGFDVEICDYDDKLLKKLPEFKGKKADINSEALPYAKNSFDFVNCTEVLEHIENPWHAVKEINKVLKIGGIAIFSTPHVDSIIQKLSYLLRDELITFTKKPDFGDHITPVHDFVLETILRRNNFQVMAKTYSVGWIPIIRLKLPPSKAFGDTLIIKAKKTG